MNTQDWNQNLHMDESDLLTISSYVIDLNEPSEECRMILNEYTGELTLNNEDNKYEIQDKENNECSHQKILINLADFNTPIPISSEPIQIEIHEPDSFTDTSSPQPNTSKQIEMQTPNTTKIPQPSSSKQIELQIPNTIQEPQPSTSKQIYPNKSITVISNVPFSEYLKQKLPDLPKRQGKRQTDRYPFALTSDQYVQKIRAKQLKKQEEDAAKEERKRLREEKKNQKENIVPNKKPKNTTNKTIAKTKTMNSQDESKKLLGNNKKQCATCCDYCLNTITRRVISCSLCKKQFHQSCIPLTHRIHIPEDECDTFLCHNCYRESNTTSDDDDDVDNLSIF